MLHQVVQRFWLVETLSGLRLGVGVAGILAAHSGCRSNRATWKTLPSNFVLPKNACLVLQLRSRAPAQGLVPVMNWTRAVLVPSSLGRAYQHTAFLVISAAII